MGSGYFYVDYDYLRRLLHLPDDAEITLVAGADANGRALICVTSPGINGNNVALSPVMYSEAVYKVTLESWGEQIAQDRPKG
jgi:hypothetical protein